MFDMKKHVVLLTLHNVTEEYFCVNVVEIIIRVISCIFVLCV
jgi:hypothetical protein